MYRIHRENISSVFKDWSIKVTKIQSTISTNPKRQILDSSKLKEFADNTSKSDENGGKVSKRVENNMEKEKLCLMSKFLLFPQCFQKDIYCRNVKTGDCLGKG